MPGTSISYGLLAALAIALLVVAVGDWRSRRIANALNAAIAAGAPLLWWASGLTAAAIAGQVALALAALLVLSGLFALRVIGGGDVKLLAALALWLRPLWFGQLLMDMALVGGVLTLALIIWHMAFWRMIFWHWARRAPHKPQIPYGLAIACAGWWVLGSHYQAMATAAQALG